MSTKRKTDPKAWFVTQDEFRIMLYAIANDYNALKARVTEIEGRPPIREGQRLTMADGTQLECRDGIWHRAEDAPSV